MEKEKIIKKLKDEKLSEAEINKRKEKDGQEEGWFLKGYSKGLEEALKFLENPTQQ